MSACDNRIWSKASRDAIKDASIVLLTRASHDLLSIVNQKIIAAFITRQNMIRSYRNIRSYTVIAMQTKFHDACHG